MKFYVQSQARKKYNVSVLFETWSLRNFNGLNYQNIREWKYMHLKYFVLKIKCIN